MKIKQIVITGDEKELEYISRTLCGVLGVTTLLAYHNMKKEACMFLETTHKTSTRNNNHHLTNPSIDEVSRIDGGDNPQDDPGKANVADNGDTDESIFPADSKSKSDVLDSKGE